MKLTVTRWLVLFFLAALPVGTAAAQGTTASLEGSVVDEAGDPIPGANVVAVHEPTGTQYGAATNPEGRYRILNMRVGGPYTVTVSFVGYRTEQETGLRLQLDTERALDFELADQARELGAVEVIAERNAVISPNRTGTATNVSEEQIESLPTISRSLSDFARLVPQASGSGGSSSLAGRNDRYNSIQIDGATLDDVFGLGDATPGSQAGAQPISLDAIQEFNVNIAPYDVRQSGFTGGQINAITKSGTNQFEGSVRLRRGSESFTGDLNDIGTGEFDQNLIVGTLGGPIIQDKLFFFVNAELKRENSPLDTRVGAGLEGTNVFDVDRATFDEIAGIAESVYGYDVGGIDPFDQRQDDEKFLAKLDWNISQDHRLTLRHNYVNARDDDGIGRGDEEFGFANRQYVFRSTQNSTTAQLNSTLSPNAYNEARLVYTRIRDQRDAEDALFPEIEFDLGGDREIFAGIDRFSQANRLDQDLVEIANDFTYIAGDHTLTVGLEGKGFRFSNLFIQDFAGNYVFESFTYEDADGEDVTVSAAEAFRRGQPTRYRYSYATPEAGSDRPVAEFTAYQLGAYLQDEWQLGEDFRLTAGLRLDVPVLPQDPTFNRTAFEAFGRSTANVASGNPLFSPRLGFNYARDFFGEDVWETQIRGGLGIFSGDPPFVWISNQYSNTGADLFRIDQSFTPAEAFTDEDGNYDPGARFTPTTLGERPTEQPRPGQDNVLSPIQTTEINLIADDFDYPQTFRTNLAVDQELPRGFVATLEGLYSKTANDVTFRNINIVQTGTSRYGRPLYGGQVSEQFTNAILLENTSEGYEYSLTGQLQRRVSTEGLGGSVSYTYSHAESVNNGTSSRAISNWQFNENLDVNNPRLGTADFEVRHRFLGTLNYRLEWSDLVGADGERLTTNFGIVYEGRSGEPFSWIYNGNANSDTQSQNDLVFVPETERDVILESDNWELMNAFIESEPALDEARGTVIERNTARAPWQNQIDLRLAQQIETFSGQRVEVSVDLENFLNVLHDDWGRIRRTSFNNEVAWDFEGYVEEGDVGSAVGERVLTEDDIGKPRISFNEQTAREALSGELIGTDDIFSRWRLRLGVRYTF